MSFGALYTNPFNRGVGSFVKNIGVRQIIPPTLLVIALVIQLMLLIFFSFSVPTYADDVRDFEIEGISIGDSLLDHFSKNEIKNFIITTYHKNTDEYIMLTGGEDKSQEYENLSFHVKKNDNQFIVHSISGSFFYKKNFDKCLNKKKRLLIH